MAAISAGTDNTREALNFLSVLKTQALRERGVTVVDPYSTLISLTVEIG